MSKYTTELRYIVQSGFDLGLKSYPIFNEEYREKLNNKIVAHYYMREIGFETSGVFKLYLNNKMNEIMDYYNQLYLSAQINFDPMKTYYLEENTATTSNRENTGKSNDSSDNEGVNKTQQSDTPMGKLGDIYSEEYASYTSLNDSSNKVKNASESENVEKANDNLTRLVQGKNDGKSYSELLIEYRKTMINIDMLVITELEELFMQIW